MKKIVAALVCVMLLTVSLAPALAYSYSDKSLPMYKIWTTVSQRNGGVLYMYSVAGSSGTPIATYSKGTVLKVIQWYVPGSNSYCRAIGPDGTEGYVWKSCLIRCFDYNDSSLARYRVNSTNKTNGRYIAYIYPEPNANYDSLNVAGYENGTIIKVADWQCDSTYCLCVGPDGTCGFIRKSMLEHVSGTAPYHASSTLEYYNHFNRNTPQDVPGNFRADASSYYPDNTYSVAPDRAIDKDTTTAWNSNKAYFNEWIEISTKDGSAVIAEGFRIANGYWKSRDVYYNNSRVRSVDVYADGFFIQSFTIQDLKDQYQTFYFYGPIRGTSFRFVIKDAYIGSKYYDCCITELELFGNRTDFVN